MILDHVTHRTNFFIKRPSALHTELFSHGDLHTANVGAVPNGFKKRISKARIQNVLNGLLAEKVIDAKNVPLAEVLMESPIQRSRRFQVAAKWFFHHDARIAGTT